MPNIDLLSIYSPFNKGQKKSSWHFTSKNEFYN